MIKIFTATAVGFLLGTTMYYYSFPPENFRQQALKLAQEAYVMGCIEADKDKGLRNCGYDSEKYFNKIGGQ